MRKKRLLTKQIKKLEEVFTDILKEVQTLEISVAIVNIDKGLNIVEAMKTANEEIRS